ncbi:mannose-ethanolamine phosphotransferase GPI13 [Lachancea thermotolerans CBS 6340]|uniref:KLTH0E06094p n=1 Tax=Lachancea thermotolerans (strain ATCC 56472 / CBS 6340 / NRRL Y-8284) TaxID=559295 RepID=C5DHP9_LACTC|nr:KLTH0E06094p [Lachancea thermotolerans CBS 6340]CAR23310.1 KLTH0E06094p [Lachancea thermotolerans CBS 6340]
MPPIDSTNEDYVKKNMLSSSIEDKRLFKSRIQRFKTTHRLYIYLMGSLAVLQIIAIAFFARGFLLTRTVLENVATGADHEARFSKCVILVIDALRFDFSIPVDPADNAFNSYFHNNLDVLHTSFNNATSETHSSLLLKFIADPPTTTLQRLKGLTTGSLPTFIDAGSNFNGAVIEEDNLIKQMFLNNQSVLFAGDDTWDNLFNPFLSPASQPFESLNVWDLDTVDNGVIRFFEDNLFAKSEKSEEWDVLIGHMLGIDHVGHKYGPNHFTMKEKQLQANEFIKRICESIDDDTLLVVMGDHGMDHTGNHGGDSKSELEAALWLHSKRPNMWSHLPEQFYDISALGENYRQVNQIDLVPTLSLLLGLPIPFNNLGWPIQEVAATQEQLRSYSKIALDQIKAYKDISRVITAAEKNERLNELLNESLEDILQASEYQKIFLESCKDLWARFDYFSIATGIILLTASLVLLITITKLIPSIVVGQMVTELVPSITIMALVSNVCFIGIFHVLHQPKFLENWIWCSLLATAVGIIVGCFIPLFDRYNFAWITVKFIEDLSDYWSRIAAMCVTLHALLFTSNSFTIWEDKIVSFLLATLGMLTLYEFVFLPKRKLTTALLSAAMGEKRGSSSSNASSSSETESSPLGKFARFVGSYHSIVLIACTRISSMITICREEQGEYCTPTFTTANNYSPWCLSLCLVLVAYLPSLIKGYYNVCSSYQAAAPIWIGQFLKFVLLGNFVYWTVCAMENTVPTWSWDVKIFKLTLSRIIAGFSLVAANIGWLMGPLCVKINIHNNDVKSQQATILGYANAYGSQYFLLILNFFMCIMLFNKPMAQLSLSLMCTQLLSMLEIFDLLKLKENLIGPVSMGLLAYQQFFSTGHQATIPAVQWDIGFILTERITFPFTHLGIVLNTFGPHIIVALSVALLTLWKQPPSVLKPQTLLARIVSNCGMLLIYNTVLCLSSFVWVTHFRRHLMVWKIFCPRFMFASLSLIVTQVIVTLVTIAFASGRLIRQINTIFPS